MEEWILQLILNPNAAYAGVVLILLISGLGAPIPEDLPLLAGGFACGMGYADITVMLPVSFTAVLGADFLIYWMGRRYGEHVPRLPLIRRYMTPDRLARAEISFHKHGGKTLFLARFMPGLRAPIYFSAGAFKLPFWKMVVFDGSAAVLSVPVWVLLAWYLAKKVDFRTLQEWSFATQLLVLGTVVVVIGAAVAWKVIRQRRLASAG